MRIKNLVQLCSALVLCLSSLLTLSIPLAHAATDNCTWTNQSGIDNNFSDAANWSGCAGGAPGANGGDSYNLIFPSSASGFSPEDDVASLSVGTITFSGSYSNSGYDIITSNSSNVITITGGITDSSSGNPTNEIDVNMTFTGSQTIQAAVSTQLALGSGSEHINIGTSNLTLSNVFIDDPIIGSGSLIVNDPNYPTDVQGVDLDFPSPNFTGSVSVNHGALFLDDPAALSQDAGITVASGALLKGGEPSGGFTSATIQSGGIIAPGHSPGCLSGTNLTLNGTYAAQINSSTACTGYDQLQVSNAPIISNATLQLSLGNGFTPTIGQSFTIINNTSSNPVIGTFNGLSEGATFSTAGSLFKISYQGGDGNDVVLSVVKATSAATSGSMSEKAPGAPDAGLAAIVGNPIGLLLSSLATTVLLIVLARQLRPVYNK